MTPLLTIFIVNTVFGAGDQGALTAERVVRATKGGDLKIGEDGKEDKKGSKGIRQTIEKGGQWGGGESDEKELHQVIR